LRRLGFREEIDISLFAQILISLANGQGTSTTVRAALERSLRLTEWSPTGLGGPDDKSWYEFARMTASAPSTE